MNLYKITLISLLSILLISCGDSSSENTFEQIFSDGNIQNEEDLKLLGIKKGKKYKVEGLKKANAAIFAFYRKPGEKEAIEYEIRFYNNHEDAVNEGIPMAKVWRKELSIKSIKKELDIKYLLKLTSKLEEMGY